MLCRLCRCPYGWLSACCPLLLGGGVGGGREKYCHYLFLYFYRSSIVCSATTPHPSFPKEGTTLGVDNAGARLPSFGGAGEVPPLPYGRGWGVGLS